MNRGKLIFAMIIGCSSCLHLECAEANSQKAVVISSEVENTLREAFKKNDAFKVKKIIKQNPALKDDKRFMPGGYTPLHWGVQKNQHLIVSFLLELDANPNIT